MASMGGLVDREAIQYSEDTPIPPPSITIERIMPEIEELNAMAAEWKRAPEYRLRWKPFYERLPNWREMIAD